MYDAKNEAHEFVGGDRDEAIRKATDYFGVDVDALRVGGFDEGEVYGLGGRTIVVASLRDRTRPTPGRSGGREEGGRGDRPRRGGRGDRGASGRGEGRGERGGSSRGEGRGERGDSRSSEGRGERGGSSRGESRGADRGDHGSSNLGEDPVQSAPVLSDEPSVGSVRGEVGEIGEFLLGTIERVKLGPFEISENAEGDLLAYEVTGAAADVLASGDGRTVDALQLLANQVAQRRELGVRVVVDVEGDADARGELLARLATRAASRAGKAGRAIALDPMNGRDRRTIHLSLRDEDGVATMSIGEGRYRQVVIVPEGAPEYDQAVRESGGAQSNESR